MGRTGTFEIILSEVDVRVTDSTRFDGQSPGRYIRFEVRDTGTGMDEQTRRRAFEPFFTTKPLGEGTGLGLASVFGAVTQNGGFIRVESQLGAGTTFTIELPEVAPDRESDQQTNSSEDLPRGEETLIVAEDEEGVRSWIRREVGDRMANEAPHVPVLYMSAYTEDEVLRRQLLAPTVALLHKPFSPWLLAQRVRAALDASTARPPGS